MSAATALVIDDEPDIRELISLIITRMGIDCHVASNLEEARNLLEHYAFDICLTDMRLPDGNGVEFVRYIQSRQPELPVAVITAHGNMEAAVEAMKMGAYDFVSKPVDINLLRKLVTTAVASHRHAANESGSAAAQPANSDNKIVALHKKQSSIGTEELIGDSDAMRSLRGMILKLAHSNAPVWITGESGTGKELIAKLIHKNSARQKHEFVPINCGAIPTELMESELFGHRKGSFTGAVSDNEGLFRKAEGGTLFLDEVAELPLHMQVKLLRAIQEKSVRAVGDSKERAVDVRILSASHKDLAAEVEAGHFRHDLYYRLNVIKLQAPSLSQRAEDIPALAKYLLSSICTTNQVPELTLTEAALDKLSRHQFPGNVRELENTLERAMALTDGKFIDAEDLALPGAIDSAPALIDPAGISGSTPSLKHSPESERQIIIEALNKTRWNRKAAATLLGLSYRQLRYRIQQYKIEDNTD